MRLPPAWRVAYKFDQIWWYQWHHCENSSAMFCYYVWSLININLYTFSYFKWVCVSGFQSVFAGQKLATPTCDPYITTFRRHWPAEIVWTKIPNVHVEHIHTHTYIIYIYIQLLLIHVYSLQCLGIQVDVFCKQVAYMHSLLCLLAFKVRAMCLNNFLQFSCAARWLKTLFTWIPTIGTRTSSLWDLSSMTWLPWLMINK